MRQVKDSHLDVDLAKGEDQRITERFGNNEGITCPVKADNGSRWDVLGYKTTTFSADQEVEKNGRHPSNGTSQHDEERNLGGTNILSTNWIHGDVSPPNDVQKCAIKHNDRDRWNKNEGTVNLAKPYFLKERMYRAVVGSKALLWNHTEENQHSTERNGPKSYDA